MMRSRRMSPIGTGRRAEFFVFAIIAAFIWPVVAVGVVGGYGFLIWMTQMILGRPALREDERHGKPGTLAPRAVSRSTLSKTGRHHQRRLPRRSRHRLPLLRRCCAASAIRFQARIGLPPQAIVNETTCTGCGDCVAVCPGEAITLGAARRGDIS
jgi:nitrate reductase NapE component